MPEAGLSYGRGQTALCLPRRRHAEQKASSMEHHESVVARNAKIVGIAGLAAGLLGGLASRVLSSQREPTRQERAQRALAELTGRDVESIKATIAAEAAKAQERLSELADTAQREGKKGRKKAKKRRKEARKQARTLSAS